MSGEDTRVTCFFLLTRGDIEFKHVISPSLLFPGKYLLHPDISRHSPLPPARDVLTLKSQQHRQFSSGGFFEIALFFLPTRDATPPKVLSKYAMRGLTSFPARESLPRCYNGTLPFRRHFPQQKIITRPYRLKPFMCQRPRLLTYEDINASLTDANDHNRQFFVPDFKRCDPGQILIYQCL